MVRFAILPALMLLVASAADLSKGRIIDRVVCSADARQSYALYLPSAYSAARKWPVLYCLEPLARGRLPLEHFQEGAEKYGYIVAGSYNSRNGPPAPALEALQAMWRDTHEKLSIDDRRAYLAGMSGGARDATDFLATGVFSGVIAQAAGFTDSMVPKDFSYPLFGTAGTDDFNYPEMRQMDRELDAHNTPHRLVLFAGAHGWAPSTICAEALAWLDLVAMRAGTKPIDEPLIHILFESGIERAKASEAANDFIGAYLETRSLAADFKNWEDTAALDKKAAELRDSKEYRKALKAEERATGRQQELMTKIFSLARDLNGPGGQDSLITLRSSIADLRARGAAAEDSDERRVARRVLRGATVQAWEQSSVQREKKDYAGAAVNLELTNLIEPDNPEVLYNLAALYALSNDRGHAMSCLKKAVEKGFGDRARLQADPSFDSIRERADFRALAGQGTK